MKGFVVCMMGAAVLFAMAPGAGADPLPGRDLLKFSQQPMIKLQIPDASGTVAEYYGHDELSMAVSIFEPEVDPLYQGVFMADDFADNYDREVVHVRWWGSYMNPNADPGLKVDKFLIAFENDVPAEAGRQPYPFSHPNCVYSADNRPHTQISVRNPNGQLTIKDGTFTERFVAGSNPNEPVYEYNAELLLPFDQKADTVYWLKIVALVDIPADLPEDMWLEWGWHNRDYTIQNPLASPVVSPGEKIIGMLPAGDPTSPDDDIPVWHFQDDAVSGSINNIAFNLNPDEYYAHMDQDDSGLSMREEYYRDGLDGPGPYENFEGIGQYSKDLAFELFTVPEPGTLMLLSLGVFMLLFRRSRG